MIVITLEQTEMYESLFSTVFRWLSRGLLAPERPEDRVKRFVPHVGKIRPYLIESLEYHCCGLPVNAGISNADTIFQARWTFRRYILLASIDV